VSFTAWACDWVGAPVQFQRSVCFIIAASNREFRLTAGKFVPVCNATLMNVRVLMYKFNIQHLCELYTKDLQSPYIIQISLKQGASGELCHNL